jgi:hypothetical protein
VNWDEHADRQETRYADALARMPSAPDLRQKQLVRAAMTAGAVGLARLMQDRRAEAIGWFVRSAERYRESWSDAPAGSWGRLIGALKARLLAADWSGAEADARWALGQAPAEAGSPIGAYAAALAELVLGKDEAARPLAQSLLEQPPEAFPQPVAEALAALATSDGDRYEDACRAVLESFESRDTFLEDIPVADTVIVLEALAGRREIAARPHSRLLPPPPA